MESKFSNLEFKDLPTEIKEAILQHNPDMIPAYTLTSRELHALATNLYIKKLCTKSISVNEIIAYIETIPKTFGIYEIFIIDRFRHPIKIREKHILSSIFDYYNVKNVYHKFKLFDLVNYKNNFSTLSIPMLYYLKTNNIDANNIEHYDIIVYDNYQITRDYITIPDTINYIKGLGSNESIMINRHIKVDLITAYNIYIKRLGCMNINPNYAKDLILKDLDEISTKPLSEFEFKNNSIPNLLKTYIQMATEASILDIKPKIFEISIDLLPNGKPLDNNIQDLIEIEKETLKLYELIKSKLEEL